MSKRSAQDNFLALDLELNQNEYTGAKIIQIGAIVGNIRTGEILERLSVFVNPKQTLESFIIKLTKIQQADVDSAGTLEEAYEKLKAMHKRHDCFVNPLVWGKGDVQALADELGLEHLCFGRREIDAKTLYVSWRIANGQVPAGGLSRAMKNLGLSFRGQAHDAQFDSENTFTIYRHMLNMLKGDK